MKIIRIFVILALVSSIGYLMSASGQKFLSKYLIETNETNFAVITKVIGTAIKFDPKTFQEITLKENDHLSPFELVETKDNANIVIEYSDKFHLKIRLASNTKMKIEELNRVIKSQIATQNTIALSKGRIIVDFIKGEKASHLTINTKSNIIKTEEAQFTINSDNDLFTLIGVKIGKITNQNLITNHTMDVIQNQFAINSKDKVENLAEDNNTIHSIDWNFSATQLNDLAITQHKLQLFKNSEASNPNIPVNENLKKAKEYIDQLYNQTADKKKDFDKSSEELKQDVEKFNNEKPAIDEDITCLETKANDCNIKSEKLLLTMGFGGTKGNETYLNHMLVELKKYKQVQITKIEKEQQENDNLKLQIDHENKINEDLSFKYQKLMAEPNNNDLFNQIMNGKPPTPQQ